MAFYLLSALPDNFSFSCAHFQPQGRLITASWEMFLLVYDTAKLTKKYSFKIISSLGEKIVCKLCTFMLPGRGGKMLKLILPTELNRFLLKNELHLQCNG